MVGRITLGRGICFKSNSRHMPLLLVIVMRFLKIGAFILYCFISSYIAIGITSWNLFFCAGILLPMCSEIVIVFHELSHFICFRLFGFQVKELKIGWLLFDFAGKPKKLLFVDSGLFRGFCTVANYEKKSKEKRIFALAAGGMSGLLLSFVSLAVLILDTIPKRWYGFFVSLFCVSLYSLFMTLLQPNSADRKLIKKILKEELTE